MRRRLPAVARAVLAQVEDDRITFQRDGVIVSVNLEVPNCAVVEIVERA